MKVLFVTSWYPSRLDPTNGNFVERHALALSSQGHEVVVVHEGFSNRVLFPHISKEISSGIDVWHLFLPRYLQSSIGIRRLLASRLRSILRKAKFYPEVVHGHVLYPVGSLALYIAERFSKPLVFTEHWSGFLPVNAEGLSLQVKRCAQTAVSKSAYVLPVSEMLSRAMQNLGLTGNYKVVYNAVDPSLFYPLPKKSKETFTFLHVSNFAPVKNAEGIVRAFAAFKQSQPGSGVRLEIVGDGDLEKLKRYARSAFPELKGITFSGTQSYEGIARLMQNAGCLVLFSAYETFGCVVAEALCAGIPVISTPTGAIKEMVSRYNGILISPGNEKALAAAMAEIIQRKDQYRPEEISAEAQKSFGYPAIADEFVKVYKAAISDTTRI